MVPVAPMHAQTRDLSVNMQANAHPSDLTWILTRIVRLSFFLGSAHSRFCARHEVRQSLIVVHLLCLF